LQGHLKERIQECAGFRLEEFCVYAGKKEIVLDSDEEILGEIRARLNSGVLNMRHLTLFAIGNLRTALFRMAGLPPLQLIVSTDKLESPRTLLATVLGKYQADSLCIRKAVTAVTAVTGGESGGSGGSGSSGGSGGVAVDVGEGWRSAPWTYVVSDRHFVYIQYHLRTIAVEVKPSDSIDEVKLQMQSEGVPAEQCLSFAGKQLEGTLDYIQKGATLEMHYKHDGKPMQIFVKTSVQTTALTTNCTHKIALQVRPSDSV
jgi:hypothetical protein